MQCPTVRFNGRRIEDYPILSKANCFALKNKNRVEPASIRDGKIILISRYLMDTPPELDCDHINQIPNDARKCNLRNCTQIENLHNRPTGQGKVFEKNGKYTLTFPNVDTSKMFYDTEDEAYQSLYALQDEYYGEFSLRRSQEIAKQFETNQFNDSLLYFGILDEINNLPEKSVFKYTLSNIRRNLLNGLISEDQASALWIQLINDYQNYKSEISPQSC